MNDYYRIIDFLDNSLITLKKSNETTFVAPHSHEFIEMIYVCRGNSVHFSGVKTNRLKCGDYIFVDYNTVHGFTEKSPDFSIINCLFVPRFVDMSLKNCQTLSDILKNHMIGVFSAGYAESVFHDDDRSIKKELKNMLCEFRKRQSGYIQLIRSSLIKIIIYSARKTETNIYSKDPIVQQMIDYTNNNFQKSGNISSLSERLNYSASRLSTLFKQSTGYVLLRIPVPHTDSYKLRYTCRNRACCRKSRRAGRLQRRSVISKKLQTIDANYAFKIPYAVK